MSRAYIFIRGTTRYVEKDLNARSLTKCKHVLLLSKYTI